MIPSNRMQTHQTMKLIMTTYPGFHDLPKGVRKMLLVSESFFFDETRRQTDQAAGAGTVPMPLTALASAAATVSRPGAPVVR